jgi:tRNA 2-selenouridine synthase
MPVEKVDVSTFLSLSKSHPVFDARSPKEYDYAHIPGAISLPIFNDEQRAEIGTTYKQVSRQDAIKIGLNYFGPQLNQYIQIVEQTLQTYSTQAPKVLIHCWRGGMRSGAMAWLLDFYGFDVVLLEGGYKAYRNFVLQQFSLPFQFNVIGGYTGSGKTEVLQELKKQNQAVIDLEQIACHKGSSFGALGMKDQPSQEQFENNLLLELSLCYYINEQQKFSQPKPIWIENESQRIGLINLPKSFYENILSSNLIILSIPFNQRLEHIVNYYGKFDNDKLVTAVMRIQKRLGGLDTKTAINYLLEGNIKDAFEVLLKYYDKQYEKSSEKSGRKAEVISSETVDAKQNATLILNKVIPPNDSH